MLSRERLRECVEYFPETGKLVWIKSFRRAVKGKEITCKDSRGYVMFRLDGVLYRAHRAIWLYVYGEFPEGVIDHINGDKADNRLINLRSCTQQNNIRNSKRRKTNTSGYKGVSFSACKGKFKATCYVDKKQKFLGYFDTAKAASDAYISFAKQAYGEFYRE